MNLRQFLRLRVSLNLIPRRNYSYCNRNVLQLHERGMYENLFPEDSSDEIIDLLKKEPQCVYVGFDPTASSLHVGNLLVLMNLLHWQRAGHQVVALLGGATGLIGDPSERITERVKMKKILIDDNIVSIRKNIETVFDNHERYFWADKSQRLKPLITVNNLDWYKDLNVIQFIRDVGKYFRLGTMLGRASVQSRLNSSTGMSFTEFTYQVFQAYDWYYLAKKYNCRFQIGGSDQMGNIMSGHELLSKSNNKAVYGLTLPLITAEGGRKFGKSIGNAVWLSPSKSSTFQFYQYFVRSKDNDVEKFLKLFTFLPLNEIKEIMIKHRKNPEERAAQRILADEVTLLVHGENGLQLAKETSSILYNQSIDSLTKLKADDIPLMFEGAKIVDMMVDPSLTIYKLAIKADCFKTENDALRIIAAGGFYVNYQRVTNLNEIIVRGIHILNNNLTLLRTGKKTYHVVRWHD